MEIYAKLRVPEIWRFDGEVLQVYQLTGEGRYAQVERSHHFPFLPLAEVQAFLLRRNSMDETSLVKAFRQWVRELLAQRSETP
jgi:hypothetical protein